MHRYFKYDVAAGFLDLCRILCACFLNLIHICFVSVAAKMLQSLNLRLAKATIKLCTYPVLSKKEFVGDIRNDILY